MNNKENIAISVSTDILLSENVTKIVSDIYRSHDYQLTEP